MGMAIYTALLVAAALWAWFIIIFGWPGLPFEFAPHAQDAAPALPIPTNADLALIIRHFEKIFSYWAMHDNFVVLAGVVVVWIVVWGMIKLTTVHAENPRQIHNHYYGNEWRGHELGQNTTPSRQLEDHRPQEGRNLPAVRSDNARSI